LKIGAHEAEKLSLEAIGRFAEPSEELRFEGEIRQQVYGWAEQALVQQEYVRQELSPVRLTFASSRLIFGLEKTAGECQAAD
jgi:hypothetical protein